jgi:carbonic anhydrase
VHVDAFGNPAAVISVMLEDSASLDNPFLAKFWTKFDNNKHAVDGLDIYGDFLPRNAHHDISAYYTWAGSLTTPPCTEGITWIQLTQPVSASVSQINQYRAALHKLPQTSKSMTNNRPVQPLNGRVPEMVSTMTWSYTSEHGLPGPELWNSSPAFPACAGTSQSPINVPAAPATDLGSAMLSDTVVRGSVTTYEGKTSTHGWKVTPRLDATNTLGMKVDGEELTMLQFHMHAPSENAVNGKLYDAEMHFVYVTAAGAPAAVVSVLLEAKNDSSTNAFLERFTYDNHDHELSTPLNPYTQFFPTDSHGAISAYHTWSGSLTTPP